MTTVDIVMRTRNRPLLLQRALDSVSGQVFQDWHLYVVNDGAASDPVDSAVLDRPGLAERTTVLHLADHAGRAAAGNCAIREGRSEFVTFHDDDDTWHAQFLDRTVAHLAHSDDVGVSVCAEAVHEEQIGQRFVESGREPLHPPMQEPTYFDELRFNRAPLSTVLVRRAFLDEIGGLDESVPMVDDWVLGLALTRTGRYTFMEGEPLAFRHMRPQAQGDSRNSSVSHHLERIRDDRRYRDAQVRAFVDQHGAGSLLYLAKYIDERAHDIHARLERIEQQQNEILVMLRDIVGPPSSAQRMRGLVTRIRG